MSSPYGITLDREWAEWAAKARVSPTVAAALLLISRSRPLPEIVARLTPGELEQIVGVIGRWPDCFPHGTLAALRSLRATMSRPNHQPASRRPGRINAKGPHTRALTRKLEHPLGAPTERGYARHAPRCVHEGFSRGSVVTPSSVPTILTGRVRPGSYRPPKEEASSLPKVKLPVTWR